MPTLSERTLLVDKGDGNLAVYGGDGNLAVFARMIGPCGVCEYVLGIESECAYSGGPGDSDLKAQSCFWGFVFFWIHEVGSLLFRNFN